MPHPSNSGAGRGGAGPAGEVRHDEGINARLTLEDLAAKAPAFRRSWRCGATRGAARGAASVCIGVGQGTASLWEAA